MGNLAAEEHLSTADDSLCRAGGAVSARENHDHLRRNLAAAPSSISTRRRGPSPSAAHVGRRCSSGCLLWLCAAAFRAAARDAGLLRHGLAAAHHRLRDIAARTPAALMPRRAGEEDERKPRGARRRRPRLGDRARRLLLELKGVKQKSLPEILLCLLDDRARLEPPQHALSPSITRMNTTGCASESPGRSPSPHGRAQTISTSSTSPSPSA